MAEPVERILLVREDAQLLERDFREHLPLIRRAAAHAESMLTRRPEIIVYGKKCNQPRDVGFFSDVSVGYFYSRQVMRALPLSLDLRELLNTVNVAYDAHFNGILVNKYCDGSDNVGRHSDSEFALDKHAGVVALSLGAVRTFRLRSTEDDKIVMDVPAREGFALQMRGAKFQSTFKHEIPVEKKVAAPRISFTFRRHLPDQERSLIALITRIDHDSVGRRGRSRTPSVRDRGPLKG